MVSQHSAHAPPPIPDIANAQVLSDRHQSIELTLKLLQQTLQAYDRYQTEVLQPYNITPAQFGVLSHLQKATSPVLMGTLASQLHISQGTLTGLVKRLEQKQWVQRIPQENDRRCITLVLTSTGLTLIDRLTTHYRSQEFQTLRSWDLAELDLLRVLLCKLEQTFEQTPASRG
ncbi:MAG: MarR family winged helix-turn-helix transcriptional regulator [Prochlorotrichaceae cyanobacterium]|jgi:DNA-binding MarR family transcriptional regulator